MPKSTTLPFANSAQWHIVAASTVFMLFGFITAAVAQEVNPVGDLPMALICSKSDVTAVGYLARVKPDGSAVYISPDGIFVTVAASGIVDNKSDGTCSGKSLDELRAAGQVRDWAK